MTEMLMEQVTSGVPADHVRTEMREFLAIEGAARVDACWNRIWIHTPSTRLAFSMLQQCMNAHESTKPDGGVITGVSDTGKSFAMTRFRDLHKPTLAPDQEYAEHPAIYLATPDKLNRSGFYKKILLQMDFPIAYNANETDLRNFAMNRLKACKVGVVMLDELHDIGREHGPQTVEYLRFIKGMVNECGRPFVAGGEPVVLDLLLSEKQMIGRFDNVVTMKAMTMKEFVTFVVAYEQMLPLRMPSRIRSNEALIQALWSLSEGYVGRLSRVMKAACRAAIESREERLTGEILAKAGGRGLRDALADR